MRRLRRGWVVLGAALGVATGAGVPAAPLPRAQVATGTSHPATLQVIVSGEK